jgi:hypothetical protein
MRVSVSLRSLLVYLKISRMHMTKLIKRREIYMGHVWLTLEKSYSVQTTI